MIFRIFAFGVFALVLLQASTADAVTNETLRLTIEDTVLTALENNRSLRVERLNPLIRRTFEEQERAAFEYIVSAGVAGSGVKPESQSNPGRRETIEADAGVSRIFPVGATVGVDLGASRISRDDADDQYSARAGLSVIQPLLRGRGSEVNLANLHQAELDTDISEYELHGFTETLISQVESIYWQYVMAIKREEIVRQSLDLAERQLEETRHRIRVGQVAETELAAAEAEVALRNEALINAAGSIDSLRARLIRLLCPEKYGRVEINVIPETAPAIPPLPLGSVQEHVAAALRLRPDINQAELLAQKGDIELVKTRNGLLPKMDLFVNLGKSGYADSFGASVSDIDGDAYEISAGLRFERSLQNRGQKARYERATLSRRQIEESLANVRDLARLDVQLAYIEVTRAHKQVDATRITRTFQEEKLRAETAKFQVGKSTALLVAAAQRDLLASQVSEMESIINYLIAQISLYRAEGSLLWRRGINLNDYTEE